MDLYLIRHADAVPVGERGITEDEARQVVADLVSQGRVPHTEH